MKHLLIRVNPVVIRHGDERDFDFLHGLATSGFNIIGARLQVSRNFPVVLGRSHPVMYSSSDLLSHGPARLSV